MFKQFFAESGFGGGHGGHDQQRGGGGPFGLGGRGGEGARRGPWPGGRGGGPFGGGWPGSWGGPFGGAPWQQRAPRANRGDVRSAVLALLAEEPMHGYQIIQEIGRRSGGSWKPSPGSVYPTLQQLEDEGLVRAEEQDGKRVFRLTDEGRGIATEKAEEFASLWQTVAPSDDDSQIGELIFGVASAFIHVARTGSAEQMADARKVLSRTRADLYRILGDDGDDDNDRDDEGTDEFRKDDAR
ncbi:MAG: PadR family transcriptional regulator [Actinomycetota bacterium]|nr:PadR family transcriptional regulator [Actinomycetota bacterium]